MKPRLEVCCECHHKRERCRPVVRHVDATIDVVCPQCWRRFDYEEFRQTTTARMAMEV